jgi:hypothetical protein
VSNVVEATRCIATFEITGWDESTYDQAPAGPRLSQVRTVKRFSGDLQGESTAVLLTAEGENGSGYVASERFTGSIRGRSGSLVFQHGGLEGEGGASTFGSIVPGSGTGDLTGLTGTVTYEAQSEGAQVTLALDQEP